MRAWPRLFGLGVFIVSACAANPAQRSPVPQSTVSVHSPATDPQPAALTTSPAESPKTNAPANGLVLTEYGLKMSLPIGWTQEPVTNGVLVMSPSKKSGMVVYGGEASAIIPLMHLMDETFGVVMASPSDTEKWLSKSGLRFSRSEFSLPTRGANAANLWVMGAAPADPTGRTAAGVIAIAVEGDGDARAAIEAALETLAPL